ncbi:MAG: type 4a pilus biogenesis protein PilO [Firmicutes bacterium]|nr:type 4a pilus biogenesis protein PilO [Bacillota bacterium]
MPLSTEVNPKQAKILIVLIIIAVVGLLYMYVFSPQARRLTEAQARLEEANSALTIDLAKIRRATQTEEELEIALAQLESFERLIPQEDRIHYVLRDIESVALANQVTVGSLTIAAGTSRGQYVEIPMTLNLSGTYNDILGFMDGVADLARVMNVHSLSFGGASQSWQEGETSEDGTSDDAVVISTDAHISATIQVVTYARPKGGGQVGAGS